MFCRCAASLHDSCACCRLQLLLCRVRGECGRSACSCRSGAVGVGVAGSGLPCVEDACEPVQVRCSWSSSAHFERVCVVKAERACVLCGLRRCWVVARGTALSVKALCAWPCVWLLRWPACLVVRFQVFSAVLADFVCPRGSGGLLCSCARCALANGGLVSIVVLGWLCFVWKCQSRIVVLPLACGRDSCVSPSSAFRRLLEVVVLHYGVVLPGCASLRPSDGVTFPGVVFGSSCLLPSCRCFCMAPLVGGPVCAICRRNGFLLPARLN
ncbi:hypothetical protein Taro_014430 [Colocasia esculenta]|uniref:Uncharacterized protein n=1 Tax=Colocasia esculenta TaxID=4460 RepID=A0A843UER0_COLES|nr:hypothetical protein [Colocasia esculenta]